MYSRVRVFAYRVKQREESKRNEEEACTLGTHSYLTLDRNLVVVIFRKSIPDAVVSNVAVNCRAGDVRKLSCRANYI